jgi:hypothetical protein
MKGEEQTEMGKEFHTLGAAELKARPPVTASYGLMKEKLV